MTDEKKTEILPISDRFNVPTIFVNQVAGFGVVNGVVNLTFSTAQFTPKVDNTVDPDLVISARLRMDLACAAVLHEHLGSILAQALKQQNITSH